MKNYTVINNKIVSLLSLKDIYRYYALCLTPSKNGFTDTTIEQLSKIVNEPKRSLETFLNVLRNTGIVEISLFRHGNRRLKYRFNSGDNYRILTKNLLDLNISNSSKGLLIALCCLTINNTNKCLYSKNKVISLIKASKPTVLKAFKELESNNVIECIDNGFLVPKTILKLTNKKYEMDNSDKVIINKRRLLSTRYLKLNSSKIMNVDSAEFSIFINMLNKKI